MANITKVVHGPEIYADSKKIILMFLTPKNTNSGDFIEVDLNKYGLKNIFSGYGQVYKLEKSTFRCEEELPLISINERISTIELLGENSNCVRQVILIGEKL